MQYPAITITSSTPFTFRPPNSGTVGLLEASVDAGGSTVYYGDPPLGAVRRTNYSQPVGATIPVGGTVDTDSSRGWTDITIGDVFSCADNAADDGKYVVEVDPYRKWVRMNAAMTITPDNYSLVFTPPDVASTNGQPIVAGTGKMFAADKFNRFIGQMKFVVASGSAVLRLRWVSSLQQ